MSMSNEFLLHAFPVVSYRLDRKSRRRTMRSLAPILPVTTVYTPMLFST
jgi:hypothetical protein